MGVVLRAHPFGGESHIQRNTNREVATLWKTWLIFLTSNGIFPFAC